MTKTDSGASRPPDPAGSDPSGSDDLLRVTKFALLKMNLDATQVSVKLGNYTLACALFKIGESACQLLSALSPGEVTFFQRFRGQSASLSLVARPPTAREPLKIFCRCAVAAVSPMPGNDAVTVIQVSFRPCPPDLGRIVADYRALLARFRVRYDSLRDRVIQLSSENSKTLGFNSFAEILGPSRRKIALFAVSTTTLRFLSPSTDPKPVEGEALALKLYFRKYQFSVEGRVAAVETLPNGAAKTRVDIGFSPELVDLIEGFLLDKRFETKIQS